MARVLTNNKYYSQIADVIREQNGTSNTYTPPQMVNALKDLFYEEVEGVPPISFNGIGENLLDYRIDGASGGVGDRTKNFIQNTATTQTKNGVTFTVNEDKSISCNGTASSNAFFKIGDIQLEENCIMSGCPAGGANNSYVMRLYNNGSVFKTDSGDGVLINSEIQNGYAEIRIAAGYTCDNLTFYPMIRLASIEDDTYEPYGYKVPVVVNGKNLLNNVLTSRTLNGVTITVNQDKSINISGQLDVSYKDFYVSGRWNSDVPLFEEGTYKLIVESTNNNIPITCGFNGSYATGITGTGNRVFTNQISSIMFRLTDSMTLNNETLKIMVCKPIIEDTSYEPYHETTTNIYLDNPIRTVEDEVEYIDYSEQKQHRVRKNLLQNTATTQTINGVTFTVNNDKSITCNGTATGTTAITINTIFSINSTKISGCPMGGSWSSFELDLLNINTNNVDVMDTGNGAVIQNENSYRVRIRIASGYTCNNLTFYPMIRKAEIEDNTYEQYIENTEVDVTLPAIPTLDGTNTLSIGTTVQPSNVYVKSRHESSYEAAMRERYEEAQAQLDALESE